MGQKVNPNGFRVGVNKDWNSTWVAAKKDIAVFIKEDHDIRTYIEKNCAQHSISKITIERAAARVVVNIYTGRPGMIIGTKGAGIETLKKQLSKYVGTKALELNIREVKNIDSDAVLVAQSVATQLEKRIAWRRAMKMAMQKAMKSGIKGIKIMVGGRLDGADIARSEHYQTGILPLHTLRSDIEYGFAEAKTTFGIIGVKCWICHGEIKGKTRRTGEVTRARERERTERKSFGDRKPFNREGGERRPFDPNRPRPPFDPNRPRPPFDPNRPRPPFDPNRPRTPFDPNRPRPNFNREGGERRPYDPNRKPFNVAERKPTFEKVYVTTPAQGKSGEEAAPAVKQSPKKEGN
jgi:small subunit ribosomal protein S3